MTGRVERNGLAVDERLANFLDGEALPGTGISAEDFWCAFSDLVHEFGPRNRTLLAKREMLQAKISAWHRDRAGQPHDADSYRAFLEEIGYLVPEGSDFEIGTRGTDPEFASIAGPQLVVPIMNARYALNAANARWGSLYDALYGTDSLGDLPSGSGYDAERGAQVIAASRAHLDKVAPLASGCWADVERIAVDDGVLVPALADPAQFVGYRREKAELQVLLRINGLLLEIVIDPSSEIGRQDMAGISDIRLESALTVIMDCEDSVAAVDGEDKAVAYRNWLGLMKGDLTEEITKSGKTFIRRLNPDIECTAPDGSAFAVKGRAVMLVRNVGMLMTNPAVLDRVGNEAPEELMDALCTAMIALHDLKKPSAPRNSETGSIYVVKPKMHGPEEVAFADEVFSFVEDRLKLARNTVKLGIMDEERRTSVNLKECIRAAKDRVAFINTGFLDRTGDEIHTSMEAGPMIRKTEMKNSVWIRSYEDRNVDIGLACGLQGKAQIGKGMWAMPDRMADMIKQKIGHPEAGASTAWVPSPTAAVLHAMHYHLVDVFARQGEIKKGGFRGTLADLLTIPAMAGRNLSDNEVTEEIENNAQGILGYVVRWVDQGVGCSKVPDINDVGLMEDRATCRISSQALANWLHHGIVTNEQAMAAMRKMAAVVDRQNEGDPAYRPMAPNFDGLAFQAACDLVFKGVDLPSGYTEPVLHARRLQLKASDA